MVSAGAVLPDFFEGAFLSPEALSPGAAFAGLFLASALPVAFFAAGDLAGALLAGAWPADPLEAPVGAFFAVFFFETDFFAAPDDGIFFAAAFLVVFLVAGFFAVFFEAPDPAPDPDFAIFFADFFAPEPAGLVPRPALLDVVFALANSSPRTTVLRMKSDQTTGFIQWCERYPDPRAESKQTGSQAVFWVDSRV